MKLVSRDVRSSWLTLSLMALAKAVGSTLNPSCMALESVAICFWSCPEMALESCVPNWPVAAAICCCIWRASCVAIA